MSNNINKKLLEKEAPEKRVHGLSYIVVIVFAVFGVFVSVNQLFQLNIFGFMPISSGYYYYILACFLSIAFLIFPARKKDAKHVAWYDWCLFILTVAVNIFFAVNAYNILTRGWEYTAPAYAVVMGFLLWSLALEGVRRVAGTALFLICLVFSLYPIFGQYLGGIFWGTPYDIVQTATYHSMGVESIIGIATRVVGDELIGYILFGAAVVASGGGKFFMDLAMALMGRSRGGAAKVSIISSAFMASLSGSVVSNIVTTGTLTIPAMKQTGYSPKYAASVEACASTGGTITPPIMGAAGFLVASFLNVPYSHVMIAAAFPAFLYFLVLFLQADFHAAKESIHGIADSDVPDLKEVMKSGWFFIAAIVLMIVLLVVYRITALAPFYTIVFLFICSTFNKATRMNRKKLQAFFYECGVVVGQITAILAGIGLIIGSFSATGVANSFSRELVFMAGDNALLLLLLGALTSFVLGIGMTVTACYVFLAVVLVPALVKIGFNPMAAHLFVMFYGNLSYITPPVALGAISAAAIAGSSPMATGFLSMRLGVVLFIIPFLFVMHPALIFQGSGVDISLAILQALIGCILLAAGFEGWIYKIGRLAKIHQIILIISALLFFYPNMALSAVGMVMSLITLVLAKMLNMKISTNVRVCD